MKPKIWLIGIPAVLMLGFLAYRIFGYQIDTLSGKAKAQVEFVAEAANGNLSMMKRADGNLEPLTKLATADLLRATILIDPWNTPLSAICANAKCDAIIVKSSGPDKKDDQCSGDDICSALSEKK
jgi:hypothetical protein